MILDNTKKCQVIPFQTVTGTSHATLPCLLSMVGATQLVQHKTFVKMLQSCSIRMDSGRVIVIGIQLDKLKAASFQNSFNHLHNQRRQVHIDIFILNPVFCEFDQLHLLDTSSDLPTFLWEACQWQLASTLKCLLVKLAQSY